VVCAILFGSIMACAGALANDNNLPTFEQTGCDLPRVGADVEARLSCGAVRVPRDHGSPEAGTFRLSVVVIRSATQPPHNDPVIYISGGPGNPLTIYAGPSGTQAVCADRDLILVDQRGTGRSEPFLCPDHARALPDTNFMIAADGNPDRQVQRHAAFMACRDEARAREIDLRDFGTRTTAEDLDGVRRALRIARWNVYGESYGTTVAMTLAALHPETVRSLVLDSIYPPDPVPYWSEIVSDTRNAFFALCAGDRACNANYPDLAETYRQTPAGSSSHPLMIPAPPPLRHLGDQFRVTASGFELLIFQLLYFPTSYPTLPRIIRSIHDGRVRGLTPLLGSLYERPSSEMAATHAAVECRDRPPFPRAAAPRERQHPGPRPALRDLPGLVGARAPRPWFRSGAACRPWCWQADMIRIAAGDGAPDRGEHRDGPCRRVSGHRSQRASVQHVWGANRSGVHRRSDAETRYRVRRSSVRQFASSRPRKRTAHAGLITARPLSSTLAPRARTEARKETVSPSCQSSTAIASPGKTGAEKARLERGEALGRIAAAGLQHRVCATPKVPSPCRIGRG